MFRKLFTWLLAIVFFISVRPAEAWNSCGHMTVACVAYQKLAPRTKERVKSLLQLNSYYDRWQTSVPQDASQEEKDMLIFMQASVWADDIKRDKDYYSDRAGSAGSVEIFLGAKNSDYSDKRMHKYWHYTNKPFSVDDTALPPVPTPNAETQIAELRKVLARTDSTEEEKSYALTWLLHLVADVHQPLHDSTRVSSADTDGDHGGNDVILKESGAHNLHFFFDDAFGVENDPEKVVPLARRLPSCDARLAAKMNEKDWVAEGFQLSKAQVYVSPIESGNGPYVVTDNYKKQAKSLAEERIVLAGCRLANLLNNELK